MTQISFADVVHQSLTFDTSDPAQALVLRLLDQRWVQRLRDISQTANTRLLYMFSEHSRFGHSLGVAYLACALMQNLGRNNPQQIERFRLPVAAAALLHDIGHLAPGSHTGWRTWFPDAPDQHESIATRIILEDAQLRATLDSIKPGTAEETIAILDEANTVPAWTWEIISGGGWNVDRGNWCIVDSVMAGVSYGRYNIPALTESIEISDSGHLVLRENRLDAMMHFAVSRHAMYRQMYQHRVLLAADTINRAIAQRARDIRNSLTFCDDTMDAVLAAKTSSELSLDNIYNMREAWWRYHLLRWSQESDRILKDLSSRLLERRLFKTIRLSSEASSKAIRERAEELARQADFDPRYYVHPISTLDVHQSDYEKSMLVQMDDGSIRELHQADPLLTSLLKESHSHQRTWLAVPAEIKQKLGKDR
ncbi:MAG: HD domain-containing protein [Oligoflexia bacterium]|nr:HD domain-containing protein [Oligoflexia bacterium]